MLNMVPVNPSRVAELSAAVHDPIESVQPLAVVQCPQAEEVEERSPVVLWRMAGQAAEAPGGGGWR